jgi:hypothetical protein
MSSIIIERIEQVNQVMPLIGSSATFSVGPTNRLYINYKVHHLLANLRSDRRWFGRKIDRFLGMGGTQENYICQLVNFIHDKPRMPIICLDYWGSLGIDPHNKATELLLTFGYEDVTKVCCISCKKYPSEGIDWYAFGRKVGPCCHKPACYQPQPSGKKPSK